MYSQQGFQGAQGIRGGRGGRGSRGHQGLGGNFRGHSTNNNINRHPHRGRDGSGELPQDIAEIGAMVQQLNQQMHNLKMAQLQTMHSQPSNRRGDMANRNLNRSNVHVHVEKQLDGDSDTESVASSYTSTSQHQGGRGRGRGSRVRGPRGRGTFRGHGFDRGAHNFSGQRRESDEESNGSGSRSVRGGKNYHSNRSVRGNHHHNRGQQQNTKQSHRAGYRPSESDITFSIPDTPASTAQTQEHKKPERKIGFMILQEKSMASPKDSLYFCTQDDFINLLIQPNIKPDFMFNILKCLANGLNGDTTLNPFKDTLKNHLLDDSNLFLTQKANSFLQSQLVELSSAGGYQVKVRDALQHYLDICISLCSLDPRVPSQVAAPVKTLLLIMRGSVNDDPVFSDVIASYQESSEVWEQTKKNEKVQQIQVRIQKQEADRGRIMMNDDATPNDNFRFINVGPTVRDLEKKVKLRKNRDIGGYTSAEEYLDIQFRLLREDYISTLRNGIKDYRENKESRFRSGDVRLYGELSILGPNFSKDGMSYFIGFDTDNRFYKRIRWRAGKRLMYGSLLCLSLDNFTSNFLFATIVNSDPDQLEKDGVFEIQFLAASQVEYNASLNQWGPFTAVESQAYYESYYHVLIGLQQIDVRHFPMQRYIVECSTGTYKPEYLRFQQIKYQFYTAKKEKTPGKVFPLYTPDKGELGLNVSQYQAFIAALSQEFSIIQGPPGTGKTYIGLKIVQTLLLNLYDTELEPSDFNSQDEEYMQYLSTKSSLSLSKKATRARVMDRPILVVCYTNHALDQFLEGMLDFCPADDIVRVGGRSKSEALAACNIKTKKSEFSHTSWKKMAELREQREYFEQSGHLDRVRAYLNSTLTKILSHQTPQFVSEEHLHNQLHMISLELYYANQNPDDAMASWLGIFGSEAYQAEMGDDCVEEAGGDNPNIPEEPEEYMADEELLDVEGELQREINSRLIDDGDDDNHTSWSNKQRRTNGDAIGHGQTNQPLVDSEGYQLVTKSKKKMRLELRKQLRKADKMSEQEVATVNDLFSLSHDQRWRLYRYWLFNFRRLLSGSLERMQHDYFRIVQKQKALKKQENIAILSKAKIIGMTTTGAAKYQDVLQAVEPPIVVVEEAAEVLEAHIVTSLSKGCQQLILIGDHKQLRPNPTVYELARDYNLELSLFERMVNNKLQVITLDTQHRMRPEISKYMRHIYDTLYDHQTVIGRDGVRGLNQPVLFFNHKNREDNDEQSKTHSNLYEAQMIKELAEYLLLQDYPPSQITIITMYSGQLFLLRKLMPKDKFNGIQITTVDNFQGEENTIIILSTVRNNPNDDVGFVKIENRICVCLSRAKYGMFVFGNLDMLSRKSALWKSVYTAAKEHNEVGTSFQLTCVNHGAVSHVFKPEDFKKFSPAGGCERPCNALLDCGHTCQMKCHFKDSSHTEYRCTQNCTRVLPNCGHPCRVKCYQKCRPCTIPVDLTLRCGHSQPGQCYQLYQLEKVNCSHRCENIIEECGHPCKQRCGENCTTAETCMFKVSKYCTVCYEMKKVACSKSNDPGTLKCDTKCTEQLPCGHKCEGTCYLCRDSHVKCKVTCNKLLPCGHLCQLPCSSCPSTNTAHSCLPCKQACPLRCSHNSSCSKLCGQACAFHVTQPDMNCTWGCQHTTPCSRKCGERCSHVYCDKHCDLPRQCVQCPQVYQCLGVCGEVCPQFCARCDLPTILNYQPYSIDVKDISNYRWITLLDCGHVLPVEEIDELFRKPAARNKIVKCPVPQCSIPIWNTHRYINKTREQAYLVMEEEIKRREKQVEDEKKARQGAATVLTPATAADESSELQRQHPAPRAMREKLDLYNPSAVSRVLMDSDNDSESSFESDEDMVQLVADPIEISERYNRAKRYSQQQRDNPSRGFKRGGRGGYRGPFRGRGRGRGNNLASY